MSNKSRYRKLMEQIRRAHQEFSEAWSQTRAAELRKSCIDSDNRYFAGQRMEKVWEANGVAYQAARSQSDTRDALLGSLFAQIPLEPFLEGQPKAIDSVIDFLEIDVMAFRCGYAKQWCLHNLKSLPVNPQQAARLRQLMIEMCRWKGQQPEIRELIRLMIHLADTPLVEELQLLSLNDDKYTSRKAQRALAVILNGRHDLQ